MSVKLQMSLKEQTSFRQEVVIEIIESHIVVKFASCFFLLTVTKEYGIKSFKLWDEINFMSVYPTQR